MSTILTKAHMSLLFPVNLDNETLPISLSSLLPVTLLM